MQYMGGKAKVARRLVAAVLQDTGLRGVWYEPFVGGGNVMEHAAPHFSRSVGSDAHPDLISMWRAVTEQGWMPPSELSRQEYQQLRSAPVSPLRGFAGFGASFGGKWFGGYGVSPRDGEVFRASQRSVTRQGSVFRTADTRFRLALFGELVPPDGSVVYCDPPYRGTTGYQVDGLDHAKFYAVLAEWASRGCAVYVSEYSEPIDVAYQVVWSRSKRKVLDASDNSSVVEERLFRIGEGS